MNFKQKLGYMCIGCLFTITGYIIASLGGGATHAQKDEQVLDEIVCRQLEVVNKEGKTVARINGFSRDMNFYNPAGKVVASIAVGESGGLMSVSNPEGKNAAGIFSAGGGFGGIIQVYDSRGKLAADIYSDENGGGIEVLNTAGKGVARIVATEDGSGDITVYNTAGKEVVNITSTFENGGLVIKNAEGNGAAVIQATTDGGRMSLGDAASHIYVDIGPDKEGNGEIRTKKGGDWRTH